MYGQNMVYYLADTELCAWTVFKSEFRGLPQWKG